MKRCPQCEFIYEDDQGRCDMDGQELIYDTRSFPLTAPTGTDAGLQVKPRWRSLVLLVIAGGVLIGVIGVDYYNFRHPTSSHLVTSKREMPATNLENQNSNLETSTTPAVDSLPLPSSTVAPAAAKPSPIRSARDPRATKSASPALKSTPLPTPAPKLENTKPTSVIHNPVNPARADQDALTAIETPPGARQIAVTATQKPASDNQKKESKLGSFLKKTGRILKRPFEF